MCTTKVMIKQVSAVSPLRKARVIPGRDICAEMIPEPITVLFTFYILLFLAGLAYHLRYDSICSFQYSEYIICT